MPRGEFVAVIDSDDVWLPERLERQLTLMSNPANQSIGVCGSNCWLIDGEGNMIGRKSFPITDPACRRAWWYRNPFCHSSTLIRKECFEQAGLYDERFSLVQDLDLWFRIGRTFQLRNLPEYLVKVRITGANASFKHQRELIRSTVRVRRYAVGESGYAMGLGPRIALGLTWMMQYLPAHWVHRLFHEVFLKHGAPLWSEHSSFARSRQGDNRGTR